MKSIANTDLSKLVSRTIEVYNRYRSPEARARLLKLDKTASSSSLEGLSAKVAACKTILKILFTN